MQVYHLAIWIACVSAFLRKIYLEVDSLNPALRNRFISLRRFNGEYRMVVATCQLNSLYYDTDNHDIYLHGSHELEENWVSPQVSILNGTKSGTKIHDVAGYAVVSSPDPLLGFFACKHISATTHGGYADEYADGMHIVVLASHADSVRGCDQVYLKIKKFPKLDSILD